jgi:anti-sigma factor RsiW
MTDAYFDDDQTPERVLTPRPAHLCLNEREVEDFIFNRLSGYTREVVEEHLLSCAACVEKVEEEERFAAATASAANALEMEDLQRNLHAGGESPRRGVVWGWLEQFPWSGRGLAAGLAVATLVLVIVPLRSRLDGPAEIDLKATRGVAQQQFPTVKAGRSANLSAALEALPPYASYRLQVVDGAGREVAARDLAPASGQIRWEQAGPWPAGDYWVRLYGVAPEPVLLREFALRVE